MQPLTVADGGGLPPVRVPYAAITGTFKDGGGLPPVTVSHELSGSTLLLADGGGLPPMKKPGQEPLHGFIVQTV